MPLTHFVQTTVMPEEIIERYIGDEYDNDKT